MTSVFREVIEFLGDIGVYDVVLPFLLIFTILFAILEKTEIFGTEMHGDKKYTKKQLNSIVAFVVGFLVVASGQLVALINQAVAHTMVLLILAVFFMVLVGSFHEEGKYLALEGKWKVAAMFIMAIGIILIFLNAITLNNGVSVLEYAYDYVVKNAGGTVVSTAILLIVVVGGMWWIVGSGKPKEE